LRQTFQSERSQPDAFQFLDRMPFGKKDAAQNIFLGILQRHFIPEIFRVAARGVGLAHRADRSTGIAPQAFQIAHQQPTLNFHVVHLLKICPVFQHLRREIAIVGQKNQAHGVVIQTSNGIHTFRQTLQAIHQGLAPFRISHGGHNFRRLVQHYVNAALVGFHRATSGFNAVDLSVSFRAELGDHLPVHAHLPAQDKLFGVPPRSNSRTGNNFL
jgi:hypothetical protein